MTLGERIKYWRERRNLTQRELSALSNVSVGAICEIERGDNQPKHETLLKILKGLSLSIEEFYVDFKADSVVRSEFLKEEKEMLEWLNRDDSLPFMRFAYKLYKEGYTPKLLEKIDFRLK